MRTIPIARETENEWHVAGIVVQAFPEHADRIRQFVESIGGAEVHAVSETGKLVVTLEAPSDRAIAAHLNAIQTLDGVLGATLVYQQHDDEALLDLEIAP